MPQLGAVSEHSLTPWRLAAPVQNLDACSNVAPVQNLDACINVAPVQNLETDPKSAPVGILDENTAWRQWEFLMKIPHASHCAQIITV
jgi:hypothetical protein